MSTTPTTSPRLPPVVPVVDAAAVASQQLENQAISPQPLPPSPFTRWTESGRLDKILALSIFDRFKRSELDLTEALKKAEVAYIPEPFVTDQPQNTGLLSQALQGTSLRGPNNTPSTSDPVTGRLDKVPREEDAEMVEPIAANQGDPNETDAKTLTANDQEAYDDGVRKLMSSAKAEANLARERERLHAAQVAQKAKEAAK